MKLFAKCKIPILLIALTMVCLARNSLAQTCPPGYTANQNVRSSTGSVHPYTCIENNGTHMIWVDGVPAGGGTLTASIMSYGGHCDGVTDDGPALVATSIAVGVNGRITGPAGQTCLINSHPNLTITGQTLDFGGVSIKSTNADYILKFTGSYQHVEGISFVTAANSGTNNQAIVLGPANHFSINNASVVSTVDITHSPLGLITTNLNALTYAAAAAGANLSHDVKVTNSTCIAATSDPANGSQCINLLYVQGALASDNYSLGYREGVQWWGGNADPAVDGNIANARRTTDISVSGNVFVGGQIWGSMGDGVAISGNTIKDCGDVCLDFEGTFNGTATGNYVADGVNGGLATFFENRNILFADNTVVTHHFSYPLATINGLETTPIQNKDVAFKGNKFLNLDPAGMASINTTAGPAEHFVFERNSLRNAYLLVINDVLGADIKGNDLTFDQAFGAQGQAIRVSRQNTCLGCETIPAMLAVISGNTIVSEIAQPALSAGIQAEMGDALHNGYGKVIISNNTFGGAHPFPVDISLITGYALETVAQIFIVENNKLAVPSVTTSWTSQYPPILQQRDNVDSTTGYAYSGDSSPLGPDLLVANPSATLGPESLTHPTFATCPGAGCKWSVAGGWDAAFVGGTANWDSAGGAGSLSQALADMAIPAIPGGWYRVTYNVSAQTGGVNKAMAIHGEFVSWGGGGGILVPTTLGVHSINVEARVGGLTAFTLFTFGVGTLSLSYVHVNLLGGNGTFQGTVTATQFCTEEATPYCFQRPIISAVSPIAMSFGGAASCPTCLTGPDTTIKGGLIGTYASAGWASTRVFNWFANANLATTFTSTFAPFPFYLQVMDATITQSPVLPTNVGLAFLLNGTTPVYDNSHAIILPGSAANSTLALSLARPRWVGAGDLFSLQIGAQSSPGSATLNSVSARILGTTSALLGNAFAAVTVGIGSTVYTGFSMSGTPGATEPPSEIVIPYPGGATLRNFAVYMSTANGAGGSLVLTVRKGNGPGGAMGDTTVVATVPLSSAIGGVYWDNFAVTGHSSVAAQGDRYSVRAINNNGAAISGAIQSISAELVPSGFAKGPIFWGTNAIVLPAGGTIYGSPFTNKQDATETNVYAGMPDPTVAVNLVCYVTTAPLVHDEVVTLRKNGADSAITITIPVGFGAPGEVADYFAATGHSVSFNSNDTYSLKYANAAGGTAAVISSCALEIASQAE